MLTSKKHGTGGEGNIPQISAPVVSAATNRKTFGSTDLMSMYSVCTRRHRSLNQGLPVSSPIL
ncbi:hypothetical protein TNCV_658991 [Trichonephila clavipes]|nr:hypothetical protein TNCV_658991 [Trichonephila clavipes]